MSQEAPSSLASLPNAARLIVLGAGTGGPPTIQEIVGLLEGALPPIIVMQDSSPSISAAS